MCPLYQSFVVIGGDPGKSQRFLLCLDGGCSTMFQARVERKA
ncbi:hypothetical protein MELA_01548 [Candidatus Methylomirabilis lanthanidiphila]|uniref:Uncharacterized protein n=1 Tax=Candidatus Methylomirabilis lanthanidiphila TaxID=2211376 RepID=A0A564ZKK0_9BACT|nr:hypothetical protein MELA_01548 [Candidatus Methylomirabilis lanthanidiphila]